MRMRPHWLVMMIMVVCAAAYAITLQATGQPAAAERFVEWAGGGLVTIAVLMWLFGG